MVTVSSFNKSQWAWVLFDLGSFGFCTVTVNTYMPIFFKSRQFEGMTVKMASKYVLRAPDRVYDRLRNRLDGHGTVGLRYQLRHGHGSPLRSDIGRIR